MVILSHATDFARLRARSGLDLTEAAFELGVGTEMVRAWESGQSCVPERVIRTLSVLADFAPRTQEIGPPDPGTGTKIETAVGMPHVAGRRRQAQLGQFMTPPGIARFMARLFHLPLPQQVRLLDAGAGRGALTEAFIQRWRARGSGQLTIHAYEMDAAILPELRSNLTALHGPDLDTRVFKGDFIAAAAMRIRSGDAPRYTHAILNPPYRKIGNDSSERAHLRAAGLETVNLYAGFVWLALQMLEPDGEMVAIIPRSFCNGPYYEPFRRSLLKHAAIVQIHLFDSRDRAFRHDGVLQENIILHLRRGGEQGNVLVSTSRDHSFSDHRERRFPFERIVFPDDRAQFIHVPTEEDGDLLGCPSFRNALDEIGIQVSTGPVVDFRLKAHLRADPGSDTVPLLYPGHFRNGELHWPRPAFRKANAIARTHETEKWLYPGGFYTVVRRFSTKEERRRVIANVVEPDRAPGEMLGFENHLNVFHQGRRPLPENLARGLAIFLNSTAVDRYFRRFNGHTQVNATDLRAMRYPDRKQLEALGVWAARANDMSQDAIDGQVGCLG